MKLPKSLATVSVGEAIRSNSRRNPHAVALLALNAGHSRTATFAARWSMWGER